MSTNDRTILLIIPVVAALLAFWFLAISPKRDEVKKLDEQVTGLEASVQEQEAAVQAGLAARKSFPRDYHRLVVLGKAVPVDDETASFLVQVNRISEDSGTDFRNIVLSEGGGEAAPAPAAPTTPTEGAASLLPIGASVGSAGLPTLPYDLTFSGTFFEIADFMAGIDALVDAKKKNVAANGRLVTIDGFTLTSNESKSYPLLKATLSVTTYVAPADQGATAGATPTGPAPAPAAPAPATTTTAATTTPAP